MKRILLVVIALIVVALAVPTLAAAPTIDAADYPRMDGSTATLPLSYALMSAATGISEEEAKAIIRHHKTSESFSNLVYDRADLLLVYEPADYVYDTISGQHTPVLMKPIGRDALVFLINDENPIESLTHQQILDIYTGEVSNWSELGGEDLEIVAYQRVANSGSQVMMEKQVMDGIEMTDAPLTLRPVDMGELVTEVASYRNERNAIGYSVYFYVSTMFTADGIKLMNVGGVEPCNQTIEDGEYPYVQDFYAVIRADAPEDSPERQLFDWLGTEDSRELIESAGYVAVIGAEHLEVNGREDAASLGGALEVSE